MTANKYSNWQQLFFFLCSSFFIFLENMQNILLCESNTCQKGRANNCALSPSLGFPKVLRSQVFWYSATPAGSVANRKRCSSDSKQIGVSGNGNRNRKLAQAQRQYLKIHPISCTDFSSKGCAWKMFDVTRTLIRPPYYFTGFIASEMQRQ